MAGTHTATVFEPMDFVLSYSQRPTTVQFGYEGGIPSLRDMQHGGKGRVYGTVKIKGTPDYAVYRRVRLIRDHDGLCIRETWSDPVTGNYEFTNIDPTARYTVISYDHTHDMRAVIADNLTPEIMS